MLGMSVLYGRFLAFPVYSAEVFAGRIFTSSGERTSESGFKFLIEPLCIYYK